MSNPNATQLLSIVERHSATLALLESTKELTAEQRTKVEALATRNIVLLSDYEALLERLEEIIQGH